MSDSYGDGWNGTDLIINGESFTFQTGYSESASLCYDSFIGCINVTLVMGVIQRRCLGLLVMLQVKY